MQKTTFIIGQSVERIASDYTGGRKGIIIELSIMDEVNLKAGNTDRARVKWLFNPDRFGGRPMKPLKTWVKTSALK